MSSEEEFSEDETELRTYTIIQFIKRGRQAKTRTVDVIPSKWLESKSKGRFCTKFPDSSSDPDDSALLHDFVKSCADPPESWNTYTVVVLGQANTYEEALKKLKVLETADNAFTGSDVDVESETRKIEQAVKKQKLQKEMDALQTKHVARIKSKMTSPTDQLVLPLNIQQNVCTTSKNKSTIEMSIATYATPQSISTKSSESKVNCPAPCTSKVNKSSPTQSLQVNAVYSQEEDDPLTLSQSEIVDQESSENPSNFLDNFIDAERDIHVPIIISNPVKCTSEFETVVIAELALIRSSVQQMGNSMQELENRMQTLCNRIEQLKNRQDDACNFLLDKEVNPASKNIDFEKKYQLKLPIDDLDSFLKFQEALKTNDFFKRDVCRALRKDIDKDFSISKSYLNMIRSFVTKNVAILYTASRKATDKEVVKEIFKYTELYKCMESIILTERKAKQLVTTEKDLTAALSSVLSNAKKWKDQNN